MSLDLDPPTLRAIRTALAANEIGPDPEAAYRLSFARRGTSGASFGIFQADCHTNPAAISTLRLILQGALMPADRQGRILGLLRDACPACPLSPEDLAATNAALSSRQGRVLVDNLDGDTLAGVLDDLGTSIAAASAGRHTLDTAALCAIACWINMTGFPATLNLWLAGRPVTLGGHLLGPLPPRPIGLPEMAAYLARSAEFSAHPAGLAHLVASVAVGVKALAS